MPPESKRVGSHGYSVTIYERSPGRLYLRWWNSELGRHEKRALKHGDWTKAEVEALDLVQAFLEGVGALATPVTVADLLDRYEQRVSRYKKGSQPKEDQRRIRIWKAFLKAGRPVSSIDEDDLKRFERERRANRLEVPDVKVRPNPTPRTIAADIVLLQSALNWAMRVKGTDGRPMLERNPIAGYRRPQTRQPARPLASHTRYEAVLAKANDADPQKLFGAFLTLVNELGWRVTAICQLKAQDVDRTKRKKVHPYGRIRKRGEVDKEGIDMWVPLSAAARKALDRVLATNPVVGDRWLFPSPKREGKPWTRWHARDLLERAEDAAGVEQLAGGDFHPYRRKWATERKHLPTPDVMAAGGWQDPRSLERAYQRPDEATLLKVVVDRRELREAK